MTKANRILIWLSVALIVIGLLTLGVMLFARSPEEWDSSVRPWLSMVPDSTRHYLTVGGLTLLAMGAVIGLGVLSMLWGRRIQAGISCWLCRRGLWPRWLAMTWQVGPGKGAREVQLRVLHPTPPLGWVRFQVKIARAHGGNVSCGLSLMDATNEPEKELVSIEIGSDCRCLVQLLKVNRGRNRLPGELPVGEWHTVHVKSTGKGILFFAGDQFRELAADKWPHRARICLWARANAEASATINVRGPWFGF